MCVHMLTLSGPVIVCLSPPLSPSIPVSMPATVPLSFSVFPYTSCPCTTRTGDARNCAADSAGARTAIRYTSHPPLTLLCYPLPSPSFSVSFTSLPVSCPFLIPPLHSSFYSSSSLPSYRDRDNYRDRTRDKDKDKHTDSDRDTLRHLSTLFPPPSSVPPPLTPSFPSPFLSHSIPSYLPPSFPPLAFLLLSPSHPLSLPPSPPLPPSFAPSR